MKKKYNVGDIVFAKSNPAQKLIICELLNGYYCKEMQGPARSPQIRFEKELIAAAGPQLSPHKPAPLAVAFKGGALMSIWKKTEKVKS